MNKLSKILYFLIMKTFGSLKPRYATKVNYYFLKKWGVIFNGKPNYLSSKIWFDGTNYGLIEIGNQVTMSSYIRVLTHDWSLHTVAKAFDIPQEKPIGKIRSVKIGDYSFIGTGTILMPGCQIGKGCIIAAGTVVRGKIPDFSIYAGSPGQIIGDSREYLKKNLNINELK
ncbi:acyltransferase [Acinetobacter pseudolwoffii]|uniref:acyltransferase n=1 Tax=Acinetobacter pseudolwoffii TaxID=2053287 RepID=UPI0024688AD5|nr:acyltransferase [Acinetobacter pseudolwoffii]MDH5820409.1 acyltransferase [Acinetobacter pseudolwoffii]